MARSKIDPQGAVRDMFNAECQADPPQKVAKLRKRKPVRKKRPEVADPASKFLTVEEVAKRYGVAKATVWRWMKTDPNFPEPIKLSAGTSRWVEEQLHMFERLAAKRSESKSESRAKTSTGELRKGVVK